LPDEPEGYRCCCDAVFPTSWERAKHWETCERFNSLDTVTIEVCGPGCDCSECQLRARVAELEGQVASLTADLAANGEAFASLHDTIQKLEAKRATLLDERELARAAGQAYYDDLIAERTAHLETREHYRAAKAALAAAKP
jgi:hypothetical protein